MAKNVKKSAEEVKVESLFEQTTAGVTAPDEPVATGSEPAPAPVDTEKEVTPAPKKKVSKKSAPKKEEAPKKPVEKAVKKPAPKAEETPKPTVKKSVEKKSAPKEEAPAQSKRDKLFPATLEIEGTTLTRWEVADWSNFKSATEEIITLGGSVYLAVNWPKKFRKEYDEAYAPAKMPKEGFPADLDLTEVMMFQQTINRGLLTSVYTEALSVVYDRDIERNEEGYFVINGAEADLYFALAQ